MVAVALALAGCGESGPQLDDAREYTVIYEEDFSQPRRKRVQINLVAPSAENQDEFAHTAARAALDYQRATGVHVVWAYLQASPAVGSSTYAIARYSPDGKGTSGHERAIWEVSAATRALPARALAIESLWLESKAKFQQADGSTDEPALWRYVAQQLGIKNTKFTLAWVTHEAYKLPGQ